MSALIRSQVVRLLRDAIDELKVHPDTLTPRELAGLTCLAVLYDRPEIAARFAKRAFAQAVDASEPGG